MSIWQDLEDLQEKRAELELQVHSMEECEKSLLERSRIMEEGLEIQELGDHLKVEHGSVEPLESKISELERKIKTQERKFENAEMKENAEQYE